MTAASASTLATLTAWRANALHQREGCAATSSEWGRIVMAHESRSGTAPFDFASGLRQKRASAPGGGVTARRRPRDLVQFAPAGPGFEPAGEDAAARRMRCAVDALERAGAVQGVQPPAGPTGLRPDHAVQFLRIAVQIETHDFRKSDSGAVTCTAILHRPPQSAVPPHERARRPRAALVQKNRVCLVRLPGSAQMSGMKDRERVGERARAVARRRKHPQSSAHAPRWWRRSP